MEQPLDTVQEDEETIIVNTPSEVGDIIWPYEHILINIHT
jgi:hypothetical protein